MSVQKHTHRLKRHKYKSGNTVYFCTLPDCQFKIDTALSLGKRTLCNICNSEFIMNEYTVKLASPHCMDCSKQKVKGDDGKNYFVRKANPAKEVLGSISESSVDDLKSRLSMVVLPDDEAI